MDFPLRPASSGGSGTVTSTTGTAPISVATGTTTPVVSLNAAGVTAAKMDTGFIYGKNFNGLNGSGSITIAGLKAGDYLLHLLCTANKDINAGDFTRLVATNNTLVQTNNSQNLSGSICMGIFLAAGGGS